MKSRRAFEESQHRRKIARRSRNRQALIGLIVVVLATLTIVAVGMDRLLRPGAFPIKELRLEGEFARLDPEVVRGVIVDMLGDNYFSLDLGEIEKAVEELHWVSAATIKRAWPHGLSVKIEEQKPVARWGENRWLNGRGQIIQLGSDVHVPGLVSLAGPDSTAGLAWERYLEWKPVLGLVSLELNAVHIDDRFSWSISVESPGSEEPIRVLLGLRHQEQRLRRFVGAYPVLVREAETLASADLRYPNGLAVTRIPTHEKDVALNEVEQ